MPNTVHGPFAAINVVNGTTPMNATWGNNAQTQSAVALASLNPDVWSAFVLSGITCTKDGVTANQLDIASGHAYLVMSDGTVARIDVVTDNTHTTSTPSTTYHLYLQPDGTWYWNTANTPAANSLHICDVTTDESSNILAVTDQRPLGPLLANGLFGKRGGGGVLGTLVAGDLLDVDASGNVYIKVPASGTINLQSPNGSTQTLFGGSALGFTKLGGQNTAGNFGVPVIIGAATDVAVTSSALTTICSATAPNDGKNHLVRMWMCGFVGAGNTNLGTVSLEMGYTDPVGGAITNFTFLYDNSGAAPASNITWTKGTGQLSALPYAVEVAPNTVVALKYQNSAAGTISDKASGWIELLN